MRKSVGGVLLFIAAAVLLSFQNCTGFLPATGGSGFDVALGGGGTGTLSNSQLNTGAILSAISAAFISAEAVNPLGIQTSCESTGACSSSTPSLDTLTLTNCTSGSSLNTSVSGSAQVSFSAPGCSYTAGLSLAQILSGSSATQVIGVIPDISISRSSGLSYSISGNSMNNYAGQSIGGGVSLSYTLSTATQSGTLAIPGLNIEGSDGSFVSISTPSPMTASFDISTGDITVGGGLQIDDNGDGVTLTVSNSSMSWNPSSCLCPTNATLTGTISGSLAGAASVAFGPTCGDVTLTVMGTATQATLSECE